MLKLGAAIVVLAVLTAGVGPFVISADPSVQELALRLDPPGPGHLLGVDELGRDVLARVVFGARISLLVGLTVVLVSGGIGTIVGSTAGYFGGAVDQIVGRIIDTLMAFPGLLLAIAMVAVLGPSLTNVLIALSAVGWVGYARLARGHALRTRELEYVQAARAIGAGSPRILWFHVMPAVLPVVLVQATLGMAGAVTGEAALSFLGLGVQPPTPSWGTMLNAGRAHILDAPHLTVIPGLAIVLLVLGFNFLGDGLRRLLMPEARS